MQPVRATALQYVLLFAATGVSLPFASLWMASRGLSAGEIGLLLALPMLARVLTGPGIAIWADGFVLRRTGIAWLGVVSALGYGLAAIGANPWIIGLGWFVGAGAVAALIPLVDVLALRLSRRAGFAFATTRGFGSAAFVCANLLMGALLVRTGAEVVIVWLVVVMALMALAAQLSLPPEQVHIDPDVQAGSRERFAGLGDLLRSRPFVLTIGAVGCVQAAHALYYAFSAIQWERQGLSSATTGALWAFAVVIEIGFLWVLDPWRRKRGIGAWSLLAMGAGAAVLRWALMAASPDLPWLWAIQSLHALTFAATYLAGVELVEKISPPQSLTAAQTLSSALSGGLLIGLATAMAGPLYAHWNGQAYLAMSLLALIGLGLTWLAYRTTRANAMVDTRD